MPALLKAATLGRVVRHPAVWSLPVMALLVLVAMPFNDGFYEFFINVDPQGPGEQQDWQHARRVFRFTSACFVGNCSRCSSASS